MLTVWKFPLALVDKQDVDMPAGATILSVAEQHGDLCLWALVNPHPEAPKASRRIAIVGTGHSAPGPAEGVFVGTVIMRGGNLVWHVFARPS